MTPIKLTNLQKQQVLRMATTMCPQYMVQWPDWSCKYLLFTSKNGEVYVCAVHWFEFCVHEIPSQIELDDKNYLYLLHTNNFVDTLYHYFLQYEANQPFSKPKE